MAQIRYHDYLRPLESFPENRRMLGAMFPGRVCGWDTVSFAGTTGTISHSLTGIQKTNLVPNVKDGPMGFVVSNQGAFIFEDANDVTVNVDDNVGNAFERIDLMVMAHEHIEVAGGSIALYSVIKGGNGGPVEPALSNVFTQVKIGTFRVAASAVDHSNTTFNPIEPKTLGGYNSYHRQQNGETLAGRPDELLDFNKMVTPGKYLTQGMTTSRPNTDTAVWAVTVQKRGVWVFQNAESLLDGKSFTRTSSDSGSTWTAWQDHQTADLSDVEAAIGAASLAALDYSSNNYVTDATSLETAVGALDTQAQTNADDIVTNSSAISTNADNISTNSSNISTNATNIAGKQATITGAATTIALSDLTVSRALVSNISGKVAASVTTLTELSHVNGVTSSIQAQLDAKIQAVDAVQNAGNTGSFTKIKTKMIEIGDWDMSGGAGGTIFVSIAHGLTVDNIRLVSAIIRPDSGVSPFRYHTLIGIAAIGLGVLDGLYHDSTNVVLNRKTAGFFDTADFDSTSYNRGWIAIIYEE